MRVKTCKSEWSTWAAHPCLACPAGQAAAQSAPPHLDILTAVIREEPPIDPTDVASRVIVLEIELAGSPDCSANPFIAYGALMDVDEDPLTGLADPAFASLGVDARISAECDTATGLFVSNAGTVNVVNDPGGTTVLSITTTVANLPAVEFHWIAFAWDNTDLTRLPASPDIAKWATTERRIP